MGSLISYFDLILSYPYCRIVLNLVILQKRHIMKTLLSFLGFIIIGLFTSVGLQGQSTTPTSDSIMPTTNQLQELTVTSRTIKTLAPGAYRLMPLPDQKRQASNLIEILSNVNFSMLSVNENNLSVKLSSGEEVSLFINGFPASTEEIKGILPGMVKYIDFLEYPSDPRFGGVPYVLNYVLKKEIGGFSKISLEDKFLNGNYNEVGMFNYLSHGKLNYSLYIGGTNSNYHHGGTDAAEFFPGLATMTGGPGNTLITPERLSAVEKYSLRRYSVPVSARLSYASPTFIMQQTLGYAYDRAPHISMLGTNTYHNLPFNADGSEIVDDRIEAFSRDERKKSNSLNWAAMYYFVMPKSFSLNVLTDLTYSHNRTSSDYTVGDTRILNPAKEDALKLSVLALLSKRWGWAHTLSATGIFNYFHHNIDYFTGGGTAHYSFPGGLIEMKYNLYINKINLTANIGAEIQKFDVSSDKGTSKQTEAQPMGGIQISGSLGKTMITAYASYKQGTLTNSQFTPEIRQLDEVMYFTGNPNLKPKKRLMAGCRVNWNPGVRFSLTPSLSYMREYNNTLVTYSRYLDGVLRSYANIGSYSFLNGNIAAGLNLLNDRLALNVNMGITDYSFPGASINGLTAFDLSLSAVFRSGNFRWKGGWTAPERSKDRSDGSKMTLPSDYYIGGSWFKGAWTVGVTLSNFFRSSWKVNESILTTPVYGSRSTEWGVSYHARC